MYKTPLANGLLGSIKSVYFDKFVDRTDWHVFTPLIFSMTNALFAELAIEQVNLS